MLTELRSIDLDSSSSSNVNPLPSQYRIDHYDNASSSPTDTAESTPGPERWQGLKHNQDHGDEESRNQGGTSPHRGGASGASAGGVGLKSAMHYPHTSSSQEGGSSGGGGGGGNSGGGGGSLFPPPV